MNLSKKEKQFLLATSANHKISANQTSGQNI